MTLLIVVGWDSVEDRSMALQATHWDKYGLRVRIGEKNDQDEN